MLFDLWMHCGGRGFNQPRRGREEMHLKDLKDVRYISSGVSFILRFRGVSFTLRNAGLPTLDTSKSGTT